MCAFFFPEMLIGNLFFNQFCAHETSLPAQKTPQ